ncbi:MAG: hypothetical protein F4X26_04155 [Chloroflexi bacterium]|nr:hypothetical protein [Chloroflexota bacterium]MYD65168.1 hypothetical protein [Chloroflexota bacterium]
MLDRQILVMTVVLSLVAGVISFASSGGDWLTVAISMPLFVTASFWSLQLSRWISRKIVGEPKEVPPPQPTAPTTSRPGHAQRRRRRRRQRGRRQ